MATQVRILTSIHSSHPSSKHGRNSPFAGYLHGPSPRLISAAVQCRRSQLQGCSPKPLTCRQNATKAADRESIMMKDHLQVLDCAPRILARALGWHPIQQGTCRCSSHSTRIHISFGLSQTLVYFALGNATLSAVAGRNRDAPRRCIYSGPAITWHAHKVRCCMSGKPTEGHGLLSAQAKMATCTKEHSRRWKTGNVDKARLGRVRAPSNGCCEASFRPIRRRFTFSGHGSAVFRSKHALQQTGVTCNHLSTGASRLAALEGCCWWQMPALVWCCGVTRRCGRCAWCRGRGTGAEGRWERWLLRAGRAAV
jgi:hypothetical protein